MTGLDLIFLGLLVLILVPIAAIDLKERRIPNTLNLSLGALGVVHAMLKAPEWRQLILAVITIVLATLAFAGSSWLIQRVNTHAKIGWGDLKFLIAASVWVGLDGSVAILLIASIVSILTVLATSPWTRESWRTTRPFGPMLAIGMGVVVTLAFAAAPHP